MLRKWTLRETNSVNEFIKKSCTDYMRKEPTGTVKLSEWVTGRGWRTKPRALPPFTAKVHFNDELSDREIKFFKDNPRCAYCYSLDVDALKRAIHDHSTNGTIEGLRGQEFEF